MTAPRFHGGGPKDPAIPVSSGDGMSLRDFFAAAALTGLLAHDKSSELPCDPTYDDCVAFTAYALADAVLEERNHGGDQ